MIVQGQTRSSRPKALPCVLGSFVFAMLLAQVPPSFALVRPPQNSGAQAHPRTAPAPIERRPPPQSSGTDHAFGNSNRPAQNRQHLAQWMDSHRELPLAQQQNALEAEPGFRQLPAQQQQRMHDQLTRLNTMAPEQRQRVIARTEAMERLTPPQRQQVRDAYQQLGVLPEARRRAVARTFLYLNSLPEPQRQGFLNSPQVRAQFNDQERGTLNNLLNVAPYLPPHPASAAPPPSPF